MPLQKQLVPIALGAGVDTKTDRKKVAVGSLLTLENAVIKNSQSFAKRDGYRALDNRKLGETALGAGKQCAVFNDELLQFNNDRLYSYSPTNERWVDKGACMSVVAKTEQRHAATYYSEVVVESAINGSNAIYVWGVTPTVASNGEVHISVFDEANGVSILDDYTLIADAGGTSSVTVKSFGNYFYVFYATLSDVYIKVIRINASDPTKIDAAVTIAADYDYVNTTPIDVLLVDSVRFMVVYTVVSTGGAKAAWVDGDCVVGTGAYAPKLITTEGREECISIFQGASNLVYICYPDAAVTAVRCVIVTTAGIVSVAPFTLAAIAVGDGVKNVTGIATATGAKIFTHVYPDLDGLRDRINVADVSTSGTITNATTMQRTAGLWTKAFTYPDPSGADQVYVGVVHGSSVQGCYFVVRSDGLIVARYQYALAPNPQGVGARLNVWSERDGKFCFPVASKQRLFGENGSFFSLTSFSKASIDFNSDSAYRTAQLGKNLHITGGFLSMYDGQSVVEHGFHLYPEFYTITDGAVGFMSDGTYRYVAVWEWTDNSAQRHVSAPSIPMSVVVNGGGSSQGVTVKVNSLALTAKRSPRSNVILSIYRTEASGAVFYRVTSLASPTYNDPTAVHVDYVDTHSDVQLIANEILYTTGGELDNWPAPACTEVRVFKNRLWLAGLESENDVWFSKEHRTDVPVEFAADLLKTVDPTGSGGVRGLFQLDDKLLAFRAENYLYTFGDGPNNTGQGGDFAEFIEVTSDVGCDNPHSLVAMPDGVAMQTGKGIYKVPSTSLTAQYFGAAVAAFNALRVTSAVLVSTANQIRFTTDTGALLVFDYFEGQWSTFTNREAFGAVSWRTQYATLSDNGRIYVETAGYYKDDGAPVRVRIETGWISLAGLGGFKRVYQLGIIGEYKTPHTLKISVAYDYDDSYTQIDFFDPEEMLGVTTYGDDPTYGGSDVYGGESIGYRFDLDLEQQKCEAIKFLIEETTTVATEGTQEAFTIAAISLYIGVKQGPVKRRQALKIGED